MTCHVAIIGSGPYGLAAASHLRALKIDTHVFGRPMDFWEQQMPAGMCLRSPARASNISDPQRCLTLDRFCASEGVPLAKPIPLRTFIEYGRWFQQRVVPDLDTRRVERIELSNGRFRLTLADGDTLDAERVVIAAGISLFARLPAEFGSVPDHMVSHSSVESDLGRHAGRRTIVVGGGQSALESAALLREAGADVEVLVRRPQVHWLDQRASWLKSEANPLRGLFYPPTDVGPPGLNQLVAAPDLFRRLPRRLQDPIAHRCIRPAGAGWLVPRLAGARISTGRNVLAAVARDGEIRLTLDDGTERRADHVIVATGFRVDVSRYPFLAESLLRTLRVEDGYPVLSRGLESSVRGLHFLGAPAARSFGPLCRFVAGTEYSARSLAAAMTRHRVASWKASPGHLPARGYKRA
jgi:cation diffusion facilitator CzcD-associated flavoprotein CzcO